jgi:hypothetical protein
MYRGFLQSLVSLFRVTVSGTLYLVPRIPGDFRSFLATATGFGTVGVRDGEPFVEVSTGEIPYKEIAYTACPYAKDDLPESP